MTPAATGASTVRVWSTREPVSEDFAGDWRRRLERSQRAHFGLDLDYLAWSARHGAPGLAVLVEEGGGYGAFALREERGVLVSGWPWRWQFVVEDEAHASTPWGMSEEGAAWMFRHARRLAAGKRLLFHRPSAASGGPGYIAGATYVHSLAPSEADLLAALDADKRRRIKRTLSLGYEVVETRDPAHMLAFARLQRETQVRHGTQGGAELEASPGPGEAWREWELPWMRLLVAIQDGEVKAGSGFGVSPGSMVDYRANASDDKGRKEGVNDLLAWEAIRRSRAEGYRWINWCGSNRFKRTLGGARVEVACVLGGGPAWAIPNALTMVRRRARASLGKTWKVWRASRAARAPRGKGGAK